MPASFELRQAQDGKVWRLSGYASRTGTPYTVRDATRGKFTEVIQRGAFARTLAAKPDVALLVEHAGLPYARTPATMTLREDEHGLKVDAELDSADPMVQSLASKVQRSLLNEMSFSFRLASADDDYWDGDRRTITTLDMDGGDCSICRTGANRATSVQVTRGGIAGQFEVRSSGTIVARQMAPDGTAPGYDGGDEDLIIPCPACGGDGVGSDGQRCGACRGTGQIDPDDLGDGDGDGDGDAGRSARSKYSSQELQHMMRLGHALANAAGQPSFPIGDRSDVARAVKAVARGSRSPARIRLHVMKNAKRIGGHGSDPRFVER